MFNFKYMRMLFSLLTVLALAQGQHVSVTITITPQNGILGLKGDQIIRCDAIGATANTFSEIVLEKLEGAKETVILSALYGRQPHWGTAAPMSLRTRATFTGSTQTGPYFCQIKINKRDCSDAGIYQCRMDTSDKTVTGTQSLTYTAWPGLPSISVPIYPAQGIDPQQPGDTAAVGQQVSVTCSGDVGDPPQPFIWLRKGAMDTDFMKITKGVTNQAATKSPTSACQNKGLSKLTYTLDANDKNLQLKCTFNGDYFNSTIEMERTVNIRTFVCTNSRPGLPIISAPLYPAQGIDPQQPRESAAVGQQVSVTCSGDVGDPPQPFIWLRKETMDTDFMKITDGVTNQSATKNTTSACHNNGRSKLIYTVGAKDKNLQIRCGFDGNYTTPSTGTEQTVNITTYKETPPPTVVSFNSSTSLSTSGVSRTNPATIHMFCFIMSCVLAIIMRQTSCM